MLNALCNDEGLFVGGVTSGCLHRRQKRTWRCQFQVMALVQIHIGDGDNVRRNESDGGEAETRAVPVLEGGHVAFGWLPIPDLVANGAGIQHKA